MTRLPRAADAKYPLALRLAILMDKAATPLHLEDAP